MAATEFGKTLRKIFRHEDLSQEETKTIFRLLLDHHFGTANDASFGAFFGALQTKGATRTEMVALIRVVLEYDRIEIPYDGSVDDLYGIVGSGKDDLKTFNISTAAAFVAAAAGVKVVKNGSRSESSVAGTTDVLEKLGINIKFTPEQTVRALSNVGITFCDAEMCFPRMAREYVGKFLFPHPLSYTLSIASGLKFQNVVFGLSLPETEIVGSILHELGMRKFMVVAGSDYNGATLDEISNIGPTRITEGSNDGPLRTYSITPEAIGVSSAKYRSIRQGSTLDANTVKLTDALSGKGDQAAQDIVAMNAGALIYLASRAENLQAGYIVARDLILKGAAREKLDELIEFSNECQ